MHLNERPRMGRGERALLLVAAVAAVAIWTYGLRGLPPDMVTVIHEGTTRDNVMQLFGEADHGEVGYRLYKRLAGPSGAVRLDTLAAMNLGLWVLVAAVAILLAAALAGSLAVASGLGLAVFLSTPSLATAASESPGVLLAALWCAAAAPVVMAGGRRLRGAGLLALGFCGLFAVSVRPEWALLALPGIAFELVAPAGGRGGAKFPDKPVALLRQVAVLAVALVVAAELLHLVAGPLAELFDPNPTSADSTPQRRWAVSAIANLPRHAYQLAWAAWTDLPAAVVILAALGWAASLRAVVAFRGLPLALPVLASLYVAAAHGDADGAFFEIERYLAPTLPALLLFAAFGARVLAGALRRAAMPGRFATLALLAVASVPLAWWPTDIAARSPWHPWIARRGNLAVPPDHDVQREGRFLLRALHDHPGCAIVALLEPAALLHKPDDSSRYLAFTSTDVATLHARQLPGVRAEVRRRLPRAACLMLYHGLDCNVSGRPHCQEELRGLREVASRTFRSVPYTHHTESHPRPPMTRLSLHALP